MFEQLRDAVAVGVEAAVLVAIGIILVHEGAPFLHAGVVVPARIAGVLAVVDADDALGVLEACGLEHSADRLRIDVQDVDRIPSEFGHLADRLSREFGCAHVVEQVGADGLEFHDLGIDGRIGDLVGGLGDDHRCGLGAQSLLQTGKVVLAHIVVLIEYADLRVRIVGEDIARVDTTFGLIIGIVSHRPGIILRVGEPRRAGRREQVRHLLAIEIFLHGGVRRGAQDLEGEEDFVAFHQLADLLHGLWWIVGVVILDEVDLATVDATLLVDHAKVGGLDFPDCAVGGCRTAERHGLADLDFGVAGAGIVSFLRRGCRSRDRKCKRGHAAQRQQFDAYLKLHGILPIGAGFMAGPVSLVVLDQTASFLLAGQGDHGLCDAATSAAVPQDRPPAVACLWRL